MSDGEGVSAFHDEVLDDVIIEITQKWRPEDGGAQDGEAFRGGCTIICNRETGELRYVIRKRVGRRPRVEEQRAFQKSMAIGAAERGYFSAHDQRAEPFAMLHRDS